MLRQGTLPSERLKDGSVTSQNAVAAGLDAFDVLAATGIALAAVLTYLHALDYYFSQDDFTFLARARGLAPHPQLTAPFGLRVLSTRLYFQLMYALFGLAPAPYHAASLVLHALNGVLVFATARLWTGSRAVALVAGLVFATFDLAFTAVFWASGVQDLLATTFLLACALIWVARIEKGPLISIGSACVLALSLLSKEIGVLFPGVLALMAWGQRAWGRRSAAALLPHAALSLVAAGFFIAHGSKAAGGGAYGAAISGEMLQNLGTYLKWTADVVHPFKDRLAAIDYGAWKIAAPAAAICATLLLTWRGRRARMAWAAAGWYALALAPVLPLLRHTYLYYLYFASAGAAILVGLAVARIAAAISAGAAHSAAAEPFAGSSSTRAGAIHYRRALGLLFSAAVTAALCIAGALNVREREHTYLPPDFVIPYDHVLRAAELARNAAVTFAEAPIPDRADLLLINPYAPETVDLAGGTGTGDSGDGGTGDGAAGDGGTGEERQTKDLVRASLRDGEVLKILRPDLGDVAFARRMDVGWEGRHCLLYDANGRMMYLGTGADVWSNLSSLHLQQTKDLQESMRCSRRALELQPNHPRANLNLGIALAMTGSKEEAREHLMKAAAASRSESLRKQAQAWLQSLQ